MLLVITNRPEVADAIESALSRTVAVISTNTLDEVDHRWTHDRVRHVIVDLAAPGTDQHVGGALLCKLREADPGERKSIFALVRRDTDHDVLAINAAADDVLYDDPIDAAELRTRLALATRRADRIGGMLSVRQYRASSMQRVLESLPVVVMQVQVNHQGKHRVRYEQADFARRGIEVPPATQDEGSRLWSEFVTPIDRMRVAAGIRAAAQTRSSWSDEFTIVDRAGATWRVRAFAFVERTDEQQVTTWNVILLDVTDVSLLENEVRQISARLDRQEQFLATVSEALVTPARELLEATDLLGSPDCREAWQREEAVGLIQRSAGWLERSISDLFEISRLNSAEPVRREVVSVAALCDRAMSRAEAIAEGRDVVLAHTADDVVLAVEGDTRLLMRMASDLTVLGAFAAAPGSDARFEVHGVPFEDEVRLILWMSESTIDAARMGDLFDPIKPLMANESGEFGEWNPGLAVAAAVARAHGGGLHAAVDPDGGMQFVLSLPWARGPKFRGASRKVTSVILPTVSGPTRLRVVVLDGNERHLAVVCNRLEAAGLTCRATSTPLQMLEAVSETAPDAVLVDTTRGGVELVHRLRRISPRGQKRIAIVCMSSVSTPEERNLMLAAGADHYFYKPLTPSRVSALRELLVSAEPSARISS
ncbi:MAG: response regulator [Planctomycetota bacterium]